MTGIFSYIITLLCFPGANTGLDLVTGDIQKSANHPPSGRDSVLLVSFALHSAHLLVVKMEADTELAPGSSVWS